MNPEAQACPSDKGLGPLYFCHMLQVIWIHIQVQEPQLYKHVTQCAS